MGWVRFVNNDEFLKFGGRLKFCGRQAANGIVKRKHVVASLSKGKLRIFAEDWKLELRFERTDEKI